MDFKHIKDQIAKLKEEIATFEKDEEILKTESCMDVFEFNKVVDKVKERLNKTTDEGAFFKNVFNTDDYYENISSYLEQTQLAIEHKIKRSGVSPEANKRLQESLKNVQDTIDILIIEHGNSIKKDKNKFIKTGVKLRAEIKNALTELVEIRKSLIKIINLESKFISNVILKEFKTIFTFFSNCVRVAKSRGDELLLVEIAGISDKILNMIQPIFGKKSLDINNLIYYYLFYEIRELKANAIGQKLA